MGIRGESVLLPRGTPPMLLLASAFIACGDSPTMQSPIEDDIPWGHLSGQLVVASDEGSSLFLFDTEAREVRTLATGVSGNAFALSPDGLRVAFAATALDRGVWDIRSIPVGQGAIECAIGADCGEPIVATEMWEWGPSWSNEGRLAYTARRGTTMGIYVDGVRAHGESLVADGFTQPSWTPDGAVIAPMTEIGGARALYRLDPGGGEAEILIPDLPVSDGEFQVSPDGMLVAFSRHEMGSDEGTVWVSELDGGASRPVATGGNPEWSPDGSQLAVTVRETEAGRVRHALYVVDAAGGEPLLLVRHAIWVDWR